MASGCCCAVLVSSPSPYYYGIIQDRMHLCMVCQANFNCALSSPCLSSPVDLTIGAHISGYLKKEGLVVPSNNARMLDAIDFTSGMIGNDNEVDGRAEGSVSGFAEAGFKGERGFVLDE